MWKENLSSRLQWFEPRVSSQRCGAGLPALLSGVSGVALPDRSHRCQPATKHRALIRTHGRSPCVYQTPHILPGMEFDTNMNMKGGRVVLIGRLNNQNITMAVWCLRWMVLVCVQGSHVYLERAGDLTLLLAEKDHDQGTVHCFSLAEGALFVEAVPVTDISRRITAFQYELVPSQGPGGHMYPYLHPSLGKEMHAASLQCVWFSHVG